MNYFSQMTPLISLKKNEIQSVAEPHRALHLVTRTFKNLYCRYFILTVAVSTGPVTTHRLRPMKLDPRPVSDQRYIQSCVRSIAERLSGVDLPGKPTNRQLDAKDFKAFGDTATVLALSVSSWEDMQFASELSDKSANTITGVQLASSTW
jgi:hypothetical protein